MKACFTFMIYMIIFLAPLQAQEGQSDPCDSPTGTPGPYALFLNFGIGDLPLASTSGPWNPWNWKDLIPGVSAIGSISKQLYNSYYNYDQKPNLKKTFEEFPDEMVFIHSKDVKNQTLSEVTSALDINDDAVKVEGIPFLLEPLVPMDLPVNPIHFINGNVGPESVISRPATFRQDLSGTAEIYLNLKKLIDEDPNTKKILQRASDYPVKLEQMIHRALISRTQAFDHPVVYQLDQRFKKLCESCEPIFGNDQDTGQLAFTVKNGKLLAKSTIGLLLRESGKGGVENHGTIIVERMMVFDLLTGEESPQLLHWKRK